MTDVVQRRDKLIPWYFVMFFVFLAIVDGTFVTIATSTHRGLVTDNAYEKGLNYNDTISAYDAQNKLNWDSALHYEQPLLTFALKDEKGMPIEDAEVNAYLIRVTQEGHDFSVPLAHNKAGAYQQQLTFPLKGLWNIRIVATWKQQHYQQSKRIVVK